VDEVAFLAWTGDDSGRSDHLNWANLRLITEPERAHQPGATVPLESLRPVGANSPGAQARSIASLGFVTIDGEDLSRGLTVPEGATVRYDLRPLGATHITGRLLPVGLDGGRPPSSVRILFDGQLAWRQRPEQLDEPASFNLDVPEGTRLLTIRTEPSVGAEPAVVELSLETSQPAFEAARASLAQGQPPRRWDLAHVPPASTPAEPGLVGWARAPDGSWLELDGEKVYSSFWLRPGAALSYHTQELGARRLTAHVTVDGPSGCRLRAVVRDDNELLWQSSPLSPSSAPERLAIDLTGHEDFTLEVRGDHRDDCLLVWAGPVLSPHVDADRSSPETDGGCVDEL
jgi:hypothetical protein